MPLTVALLGAGVSGVWQPVSPGANTWKVIVPVGWKPPIRWATSWIVSPTITGPEASVVRVGVDLTCVLVNVQTILSPAAPDTLPYAPGVTGVGGVVSSFSQVMLDV